MKRDPWDEYFLSMAGLVSSKSKDPSTKVGAVIVTPAPQREVRSTGYNGFPRRVRDDPHRYADRDFKYLTIVHAELNAILTGARHGSSLSGCSIYVTWPPCSACAGAIIQAGITRVVCPEIRVPGRWAGNIEHARAMLREAGVLVEAVRWKAGG